MKKTLQQAIHHYYLRQQKDLIKNFHASKKTGDTGTIHQMRLNVKKIKAVFGLMAFINPREFHPDDSLGKVAKLFKSAGSIRDVQVQISYISLISAQYQINAEVYMDFLNDMENQLLEKFRKKISLVSKKQLLLDEKQLVLALYTKQEDVVQRKILTFIRQKTREIRELRKKRSSVRNLHSIRAILKTIQYLLNMTKGRIPEYKGLKVTMQRLHETQELLGKWHDTVNAVVFLNLFLRENEAEILSIHQEYVTLRSKILHQQQSCRKQIEKILKEEMKL